MGATVVRIFVLGVAASVLMASSAQAGPPGCSPCYTPSIWTIPWHDLHPGLLKSMSVRWCGIAEAPTIIDPGLVCQPTVELAMWRRLINANECVMLPGALISLRSGAAQTQAFVFPDPGPLGGFPGYIEYDAYNVEDMATELWAAWEQCDMLWSGQPKGALALHAWAIAEASGSFPARGVAVTGSVAFPWMAVSDPEWLVAHSGQFNERSVAHEAGHVMNEDHATAADNLMTTGGDGTLLTPEQRDRMRTYLDDHPSVDPPPQPDPTPDLVEYYYDKRGDGSVRPLDVYKVVVVDRTPSVADVEVHIALAGLVEDLPPGIASYGFALDIDATPATGLNPVALLPGATLTGAELVGIASYDPGAESVDLALYGQSGRAFVTIPGPHPKPTVNDISIHFCGLDPEFPGPDKVRVLTEIGITIPADVLFALGAPAGDGAFPSGARIQIVASNVDSPPADAGPDDPMLLTFPPFVPPGIETATSALPGEIIDVSVDGFAPSTPLAIALGDLDLETSATTDGTGAASFPLEVPSTLAVGPRELAVRADDPSNIVTAETFLVILPFSVPAIGISGIAMLAGLLLGAGSFAFRRHRNRREPPGGGASPV